MFTFQIIPKHSEEHTPLNHKKCIYSRGGKLEKFSSTFSASLADKVERGVCALTRQEEEKSARVLMETFKMGNCQVSVD